MKNRLKKLLAQKNTRKAEISAKADASTDVAELRGLNTEMETINAEIRDLQGMIDELPEDGAADQAVVAERTVAVNGLIPDAVVTSAASQEVRKDVDADSVEYRKAFQQFVTKGTPIPTELRSDANTLTTDIASAIPTVLVNKIVEKIEAVGMILPLITQTSFPAGIKIPTSSVIPVATFVGEGASSDRQKKTTSSIAFTNFKLRCEISMSMESSVMALSAFEASFVAQVSKAMVKKIESVIVSTADGSTSNKGILAETPATGQALEFATLDYQTLIDAEAALPEEYEGGAVWCMTKKTFMAFTGMVDTEGQPIARTNYGIGGKPERILLGRPVVTCGSYLDTFSATLAAGKIFAFIFNFEDYALNTIYDMGIQRKQDWDTEDLLTKAVMSIDGKVIDKNSLVTLAKKA